MDTLANSNQADATIAPSMMTSPKIAVAGVSGYAGGELARLLLKHPRLSAESVQFYGRGQEGAGAELDDRPVALEDLHPHLASNDAPANQIVPFSFEHLSYLGTDLLFLATPHEQSRSLVPDAIARGIRVVDLSGAWRLKQATNRKVYGLIDADPMIAESLQDEAVYGCPELHRDEISTARLVANPGCYATSIVLALAPIVRAGIADLERGIVCDAKSGVSGAGKAPSPMTHYIYAADNFSAYNVFGHRHTGELLEQLGLNADQILFTPHLLPIPRGILSTIYVRLFKPMTNEQIAAAFRTFYETSPMVRLRQTPRLPQIQHVVRTNYCDLGFELSKDGKTLVIVSCLDNLLKGAAGQAMQNMNVMFGWGESEGLL